MVTCSLEQLRLDTSANLATAVPSIYCFGDQVDLDKLDQLDIALQWEYFRFKGKFNLCELEWSR